MELDSRIIEGKKPLDCFDAENKELIKPFLNKEGYVSNNLENFCLLDGCFKRLLINVFKERKSCFTDDEGRNWKFFLPEEWVKEPEEKYRSYSLEEKRYLRDFLLLPVGDFTTIRLLDRYDNVLFQDYYCRGAENFPKYLNNEIVHISVADNVLKVRLNYFK